MQYTLAATHGPIARRLPAPRTCKHRSGMGVATEALWLFRKHRTHGTLCAESADGKRRVYVTLLDGDTKATCSLLTYDGEHMVALRRDVRDIKTQELLSTKVWLRQWQ